MPTKREISILAMLVALASVCCLGTVMNFVHARAVPEALPPVEKKFISFSDAAYLLKEQGGYVAVFSAEPRRLLEVTPIPVQSLRRADRLLLQQGITARSRTELLRLLEDLGS